MAIKRAKSTIKSSVRRRLRTVGAGQQGAMVPGGEQDVKRRTGNFETAGEHAHVGGRTSGIVGQTTKRFRTDNRSTRKRGPKG
jgi:hypothetical protein